MKQLKNRQMKNLKLSKQEQIEELKMDIQYQVAILANGWHDTQMEKYEAQAELEQLEQKLINLKK